MNILWVVPRFHSNLIEVEQSLLTHGFNSVFLVSQSGNSDIHAEGEIFLVDDGQGETIQALMRSGGISFMVLRSQGKLQKELWDLARKHRVPSAIYDQGPSELGVGYAFLHPYKSLRFVLSQLKWNLLLGDFRRITPVKFWGTGLRFKIPNTSFVPFPVPENFSPIDVASAPKPRVMTVAKHGQKRKRAEWLVRAQLRGGAMFDLTIVGSSPRTAQSRRRHIRFLAMVARAERAGCSIRIHYDLSRSQILHEYKSAHLFVLASRDEPFAVSPLEALAAGRAVLLADDNGSRAYLEGGVVGSTFRSHSFRSFEKALKGLVGEPLELQRMSENIPAVVRRDFNTGTFVKSFVAAMKRSAESASS